jgi:hypothetical protein
MSQERLKPPFRRVARWVTYLILVVATTALLLLGAVEFPLLGSVFNPHSTVGGLMLIGLSLLALLIFLALIYLVPRAGIELYQRPLTRAISHWAVFGAGLIALVLLAIWLSWWLYR